MANAGQLVDRLYRLIPAGLRYRLKESLSLGGHGSSLFDGLKAKRDASGKKRLDRAMEGLVTRLSAAGVASVAGKKCLEIGTGFVPSDGACLFLLGAERVVMTDYNAICKTATLETALNAADLGSLQASARSFAPEVDVAERLKRLEECVDARGGLERLGITYVAPFDLSVPGFPEADFDLIYSVDVLEHLPPPAAGPILENLARLLGPNGEMVHDIDLKDHRDMAGAPFAFLGADTDYRPESDCDARGNRLRPGEWADLCQGVASLSSSIVWREPGAALPRPAKLAPGYAGLPEDEAFCSRVILSSTRS